MTVSWRRTLKRAVGFQHEYIRCFLAEFFGSLVLVYMIDAMAAHATFNRLRVSSVTGERQPVQLVSGPDHTHLIIGAGLAVMMGVLVCGGVSGAHLNPAVSLAFAAMGRISWKKMLVYMAAQYIGAMVASAGIYVIYVDTFSLFSASQSNITAAIFATYPTPHISWTTAFFDQIVATSVLMFGVLAIIDEKLWHIPSSMVPLYIGLLISAIVACLGYNTGAAMNPARDLMPRLFTYLAGWGEETFSTPNFNGTYKWFWIPIVGSHLGALLGVLIYQFFIAAHWPDDLLVKGQEVRGASDLDSVDLATLRTTPSRSTPAPIFKPKYNDLGVSPVNSDAKRGLLESP
ncbi:aquaporin-3-like [Paramacrobiotus metropolitanus]|uniref:aquaporin-3-like n=1 Tax=Paramacrobiotus metropolitanus TaxID=2943436 RepID=UPI002445F12E|nr:aquaporin-3-like [Paramacrobiotus metropolitanus]